VENAKPAWVSVSVLQIGQLYTSPGWVGPERNQISAVILCNGCSVRC